MPSRTITTTAETLIPVNRHRRSLIFQNEDSAINIFVMQEKGDDATVSTTVHDHRLGSGGSLSLNFGTDGKEAIQGRWTVIATSGTPRISLFETEDIVR